MTELDRRELARVTAWLVAGLATGVAPAGPSVSDEMDVPGGRRLLLRALGPEPSALRRARRLRGSASKGQARLVFAAPGRGRVVAELAPSGYRFSVVLRRGSVTVAGSALGVSSVTARRVRRHGRAGVYDTAVAIDEGVLLTTSSALAQRHLPPRLYPGTGLPAVYERFAELMTDRLARYARRG